MAKLSGNNQSAIDAHREGYYVTEEGSLVSPRGTVRVTTRNAYGYERISWKRKGTLLVHKLAAYQKFGDDAFKEGICVRHLDGNPANNAISNIEIGTRSENMMDQPKEVRVRKAKNAAQHQRKLTDEEVRELRFDWEKGATYDQLAAKYELSVSAAYYAANLQTYVDVE